MCPSPKPQMFWIEPSYVLNCRPKFNEFDILPSLRSLNEFDTLPQESPQTPISPPQHRRRNLQDGLLACASSEGRVCFVELIIICWTKFTYQRLWCRMDCCSAMPDDCWSATHTVHGALFFPIMIARRILLLLLAPLPTIASFFSFLSLSLSCRPILLSPAAFAAK